MEHPPLWARPLAWCLHALGLLLILAPLLDLAAGVGSLNPGAVPWRFGAAGLLSGALVLPTLGTGLMLVAAVVLEQRAITRVIGTLALLLVLVILAVTALFSLDALQVRTQIPQNAKRAFDLASAKAILTFVFEAVVMLTLAINAFRSAKMKPPARSGTRQSGTLVVGKAEP